MNKLSLLVFCVTLFACTFADDDGPCPDFNRCDYDECCLPVPGAGYSVCRDKPDDYGQPCGGPYACSSCGDRLQCVPNAGASQRGYTGTCGGGAGGRFFGNFFDDDD